MVRDAVQAFNAAGYGESLIIVEQPAIELPHIMIDEFLVRQAILNILINSAESTYTQVGAAELVVSSCLEQESSVVLYFDSGSAVWEAKEVEQLLDLFRTRKEGGTGLGLWLSRLIVESHGGTLTVRPRREGGLSFRMGFPVAGDDLEGK